MQLKPHHSEALRGLFGRSLLATSDATAAELDALLALAATFRQLDFAGVKVPLFAQELAYAVFFDNSTRTKSAWAGAAARLGMQPVIVDGSSTQVAHGETASETGAMLGMNAHAMGIRHDLVLGEGQLFMKNVRAGIDGWLAANGEARKVPVVNLQCDVDHPTQTLADLSFLRHRFGTGAADQDALRGKAICVSWAYSPSYAKPLSVPQGLITLLTRQGAHVRLAHPPGYELLGPCMDDAHRFATESGGSFSVHVGGSDAMDEAFEGAHVVYPKSWGPRALMEARVAANAAGDQAALDDLEAQMLTQNADHTDWICDSRRMALTAASPGRSQAQYMHCLPADIGDEVSGEVMAAYRDDLAREASWKVYAIMALLTAGKHKDPLAALSDH
ncbi:MAG: hypothetical protein KC502_02210 [Myxococcales bacterium]|nr:hypothetical protein [Myxococcales bacterium]